MIFRNFLAETELANTAKREEFNALKLWQKFENVSKNVSKIDDYIVYKHKDYYFLTKDGDYIAYIDATIDKLESNPAIFIDSAHASVRGSYAELIKGILKTKIKIVVSGVQLSTDAQKYYAKTLANSETKYIIKNNEKIIKKQKSFTPEEVKEIFSDPSLTIGQI